LDGVLEKILELCESHKPPEANGPSPCLSPEYGGEE
jgi:hypothetical protein